MIDTTSLLQSVDLVGIMVKDTESAKGGRMFCPFCQVGGSAHNNSPALSARGQHWHCFGCGASGDALDYIMQRDRVDFLEAARRLGWDGYEPDREEIERRKAEAQVKAMSDKERRAAELDALPAAPGAVNIPLGQLESRLPSLDKNKRYVLACRSGNRSNTAAQILAQAGRAEGNFVQLVMAVLRNL